MVLVSVQVVRRVVIVKNLALLHVPGCMHLSDFYIALWDGSLEGVEPLCLLPEDVDTACISQIGESQSGPFCDCVMTATIEEAIEFGKYVCFKLSKPQQEWNSIQSKCTVCVHSQGIQCLY